MKYTVAQKREMELVKLVSFRTYNPTEEDYREAKRLMNSYYRLCGLSETNLYLSNKESTCNSKYTKASEDKEMKWFKRLRREFEDYCGLTLFYTCWYPSIGLKDEHGGVETIIHAYFY